MVLDEAEVVHKVTIVPRGQAGGYAMMLPKQDRFLMTEPELLDKICGLLGGRVSEDINFHEVSTGASNDFERATQIARSMVTEYGMSKKLGPLQFSTSGGGQVFLGKDMQGEPNYSGQIAYEIDKEVQRIIKEQYERCKQILLEHESQLKLIAKTLLTEETLVAEQIRSLFYDGVLPTVDYDAAKVVKDEDRDDSEFSNGKYGKSYDDIREEQLEEGRKDEAEDRREDDRIDHDRNNHRSDRNQSQNHSQRNDRDETGYEQSPNIEHPTDSNHREIVNIKTLSTRVK